ncbi:MAG: ATP-binding protein [Gemmataceae bacterium]|nr:ATP-binding protein [Gemmataceae bacterium]
MSRKLLFQVSAPTVLIALLLFVACLLSAWHISRLQRDLAKILTREVTSLQAAQELEIRLRQLRFRNFLNLLDPRHARAEPIQKARDAFEEALERASSLASTAEEQSCVRAIRSGYQRYKHELEELPTELARLGKDPDLHRLEDAHPIRHVVDPCQELLLLNKEQMEATAQESEYMSRVVRLTMLGLGVAASLSGLIGGFGIARGLSRSIYQLSVHVQDITHQLDRTVASVDIPTGGDIQQLDRQLQHIVSRVEEVARELHRHQRELLRAEQLAAVGQLAASVAHEVRNPLTSIKLLVEGALRARHRTPLGEEDLQVIHGEVVRLEQRVQGLLDFARPPALQRQPCDLREVVTQAVDLVGARARHQGVAVEAQADGKAVRADADSSQLCTVLVNLLLNALDAMPGGGVLRVALAQSPEGARLEVSDTGPGIAPEMADRLFTPFASTRPTGTGLGLSISRRIVEDHGGALTAANRPSGGACFTVTLPPAG